MLFININNETMLNLEHVVSISKETSYFETTLHRIVFCVVSCYPTSYVPVMEFKEDELEIRDKIFNTLYEVLKVKALKA